MLKSYAFSVEQIWIKLYNSRYLDIRISLISLYINLFMYVHCTDDVHKYQIIYDSFFFASRGFLILKFTFENSETSAGIKYSNS
jgi:hypothetical protein